MAKKEQKVKVINDLVATIMKLGVNFAEKQVEKKLDDPITEEGVNLIFPLSKELINALSDNNPDNEKQVREIMLSWTNHELADFLTKLFDSLISKVKDENVKVIVSFVATQFISVLKTISDSDTHNAEQLKALWNTIVVSDEMKDIIINHILRPVLVNTGATGSWNDFVVEVAETALSGLIAKKEAQVKLIDSAKALN